MIMIEVETLAIIAVQCNKSKNLNLITPSIIKYII